MKRTIIIFIQQISYIFMHYVVSISILNILSLSSIIFSFLLDYYLYDSKITKNQILGIIIGYLGIIITTNH
jgi:drug/metabolite transporter (DMT)-like permease